MEARAADPPAEEASTPLLVIGVLGGIASGKSAAARFLAGEEGLILSADEMAHEVLASDELSRLIAERFGAELLDATGQPDRERLAGLVFDPEKGEEARRALEGWIHPRVRARILERLRGARVAGVPRVVLDVPLLLENDAQHGLTRECDALVFVDVGDEERDRRAQLYRGWAPGEVARRESAQLPLATKRERADFVLPNEGSLKDLERAAARVLEAIEAR